MKTLYTKSYIVTCIHTSPFAMTICELASDTFNFLSESSDSTFAEIFTILSDNEY